MALSTQMAALTQQFNDFGVNIGRWLLLNGAWLILAGGLCVAGFMGIKKNYTGAIITLIITAVVFVIMLNAEAIMTSLGNVVRSIIGF